MQGQDAELKFCGAFGQSPETIEEGTAVLELVGNEFSVGIEAGAIALVFYAEQSVRL